MLNAIKKARLIAGISQSDLARAMNVSQGSVSLWERGKTKPTARKLPQLASILETTVDDLLTEERVV